ncbi:MAG: hypothetical protein AB4063_12680 [Crocosphaera sp.]
MKIISTRQYLKIHGIKQNALAVNKVEEEQTSTTDKNIDVQQKKLAFVNEQIKTVLLILSILLQVVKIVPVIVPIEVSSNELNNNVETSTIELEDNYVNRK